MNEQQLKEAVNVYLTECKQLILEGVEEYVDDDHPDWSADDMNAFSAQVERELHLWLLDGQA